mmetsp:Transcript_5729/g.12084  ORF Transcript_5729/g.12084 Transcript_5729/m.12084 type:complete len:307 (+) Transcript_5729:116-1036(+)
MVDLMFVHIWQIVSNPNHFKTIMWPGSIAQQIQSHRRGRRDSGSSISTGSIDTYGPSSGDADDERGAKAEDGESSSTNSLSGGKENNTSGSADSSSTDENGVGSSSPSSSGDDDGDGSSSPSSSGGEGSDGSSSSSYSGDEDGDAPPFATSLSSRQHDQSENNDDNNTTPCPPAAEIHEESTEGISNATASRPDILAYIRCRLNLIQREIQLLLENMVTSAPHHLVVYPRGVHSMHMLPQASPRRVQKCSICGQPRKNHICPAGPTMYTRDIGTNTDPCKDEGDKISLSNEISIIPVSFDNRHART